MTLADPLGLVGQRLGPYVVREAAGMGGVALIYRGEHEALKSGVAVKVLRPELVEDAYRTTLEQMFLREAQILSQLRSDDILRALDHGRVRCGDGEERPYIVVDWLEGETLSDDLERRGLRPRRPYTLPEAIDLLEPIARALAVCHQSGIVHRDVNPRNVFLENLGPGRPPRAKLIDFGFAKEVARTEALRLQRVDGTLLARSPDYAAPEHYDREKYGELSENTDIYTLALMLVEMLTLAPPLRGMTDDDLRDATANPADRPTPGNRGAQVSPEVEALFAEALAVDQMDRPGILLEFWEKLKAAASAGGATSAAPEPAAGVVQEPAEPAEPAAGVPPRRGGGKGLLVLLLLLGVSGAALFYFGTRPLQCPPGFSDCNGKRADGCEAELGRDPSNCGACSAACGSGGSSSCVAGQCRITRCPEPHLGDCNQRAADGCEADLRVDEKNCGECGRACGENGVKEALCLESRCQSVCKAGYGDCDGTSANGCETSLATDAKNCGRCGFTCAGTECTEGLCAPTVLASPISAPALWATRGAVYFWDEEKHRIERLAPDGQRSVVVNDVSSLTTLTVSANRVVWAAGDGAGVLGHPLDAKGPLERIASRLASDTPLSVSASGYVSWANRAKRADSDKSRQKAVRGPLPLASQRRVFSAPLDSPLDEAQRLVAECPEWPHTFAADGRGTYCCDRGKPLTLVECPKGHCSSKTYNALCPDELGMDEGRLYFAQDVRLLSLDRKTGGIRALARRKKHPRTVTLGPGHLYWLEGDRQVELWRLATESTTVGAPELLARRQIGVTALAPSQDAVYWVAQAKEGTGTALHRLALPGP